MSKIKVVEQWHLDELWVYHYRNVREPGTCEVMVNGQWEHRAEGASLGEPTFRLKSETAGLLAEALSDHLPPSAATSKHLADAISVRDRLLSIVEQT